MIKWVRCVQVHKFGVATPCRFSTGVCVEVRFEIDRVTSVHSLVGKQTCFKEDSVSYWKPV